MRYPRFALGALAAAAAGLSLAYALAPEPARADKIHLVSGRVIEGKVVSEEGDDIVVRMKYGEISYPRDKVVRIEYELTAEEKFDVDLEKAVSADDCLKIAAAGQGAELDEEQIAEAFEKALTFDPNSEKAHEALGHVKVNGKWLASDDAKREMGWILYDGELMPPEKVEAFRRQRREEAKARAEASRKEYESELKGVSWGRAVPIETDHYIIVCNSSQKVAQRYADFMEKIYDAYDDVFKGYKRFFKGKSKIYIFRNVQDFHEYGGGRPGVGGYYRPKSQNEKLYPSRIVSAYHGTFGTTGDTRLVLAHEGTHQFQHILCDGSPEEFLMRPAWWVEGLAVYFGDGYTFDKKGDLQIGIPRDRLTVLQKYLKSGNVMPISRFIRLPYRNFSQMAGIAYPYGWSLCHYFLHRGEVTSGRGKRATTKQVPVDLGGKKVELAKVFKQFFDFVLADPPDAGRGRGFEEHYATKLEELLGMGIDEITDDWREYVLSIELEPLGQVSADGQTFTSPELAFEIAKPSGWEWRADEVQGRETMRFVDPSGSGLVIVSAQGNMDNSGLSDLVDQAERGAAQKLDSFYAADEDRKAIDIDGYEGVEFTYEGTEVAPLQADRQFTIRDKPQKYRHVVVTSVRRSYEVVMQANADEFDDLAKSLDEIVKSFKILE